MDRKWLIVIALVFGLFALGYWGYSGYLALSQAESELNNRYEDSFQGLNNHIDALESELGTILISDSAENLSVNLSNIWRSAYSAQEDVGNLPISINSLNNVKGLLENVLDYTNHLDRKVVDGGLEEKDKKMMNSFYNQVSMVNKNMESIHDRMDKEKFKWHNKKRVKVDEDDREFSASPLAGLAEMDGKLNMDSLKKELDGVLPKGTIRVKERDVVTALSQLDGDDIDQAQGIKMAKKFIKNPEEYNYEVMKNEKIRVKGTQTVTPNVPAHSIRATKKDNKNEVVYVDVTKKGGKVIWLLNQRRIGQERIKSKEAQEQAIDFLEANGYEDMVPVAFKSFSDIMIISLAPKKSGILIKADAVSVQVALDNGDVIGFNGVDYLLHHKDRDMSKLRPKLTKEDAKKRVSNNLNVKKGPNLVLDRKGDKEVLCYEFIGVIGKGDGEGSYKVNINAKNGNEETVKSIDEDIYKNVR